MKRFIIKTIGFLASGVVAYILLLVLFGEVAPRIMWGNLNYPLGGTGYLNTRIKEIPSYHNMDVIFLGSSHVYRGFDVRIAEQQGYTSFNLGSSSQTPIQAFVLLKRYLDQLNPRTVVYEVSPMGFMNSGAEAALDLSANDWLGMDNLKMAFQINDVTVYNSLVYGAYRQFFGRDKRFVEEKDKGSDKYVPGGFVESDLSYFDVNISDIEISWNPYSYQVEAFEQLVAYMRGRGIKVILVQVPVSKIKYKRFCDSEQIDSFFGEYGPYYNFNQIECGLDDEKHFLDSHHLNQAGVELFNDKFFELFPSMFTK